MAKRVIDCTGDADIAYLAGAPCIKIGKKDKMDLTTIINCSGVNKEKFMEYASKKNATYADWGDTWTQHTTEKEK